MAKTSIAWTDRSENPIRQADSLANYCVKISPGCKHCYAETMSRRLAGISHTPFHGYKHMPEPPKMALHPEIIASWATRKKSYKNFIGSMTDIFLDTIPEEWIWAILDGCIAADNQIFQILTKRPKRMMEIVNNYVSEHRLGELPGNIWLGVSAEDQRYYSERTEFLCQTRCKVRFVSCEPLLGPIDLTEGQIGSILFTPITGVRDLPELPGGYAGRIHWIIGGGESGNVKDISPSHIEWFRSLRDQCKKYNAAFFFKQWGEWAPGYGKEGLHYIATTIVENRAKFKIFLWPDDTFSVRCGRNLAGNILDGILHEDFPIGKPHSIPNDERSVATK